MRYFQREGEGGGIFLDGEFSGRFNPGGRGRSFPGGLIRNMCMIYLQMYRKIWSYIKEKYVLLLWQNIWMCWRKEQKTFLEPFLFRSGSLIINDLTFNQKIYDPYDPVRDKYMKKNILFERAKFSGKMHIALKFIFIHIFPTFSFWDMVDFVYGQCSCMQNHPYLKKLNVAQKKTSDQKSVPKQCASFLYIWPHLNELIFGQWRTWKLRGHTIKL